MPPSAAPARSDLPFRALALFLVLAFGIAWGIFVAFVAIPGPLARLFGPPSGHHPLFIIAVYAPAISAFFLVLRHGGLTGLGRFLSRLLLWRCSWGWAAFLVLGIPAIYALGAALKGSPLPLMPPFASTSAALGAIGFMLILGPVEEFGWRGLALPLLQRRMAPVGAALVLGAIWGLWHLPAFYLSGTPQSAWDFFPFFLGSVSVSVILTPLFNAAKGSILLAALYHFQLNNPLWPDAQPYDMWLFAAAALVTIWLHRGTMFSREGAYQAVIPA
jgi:membrane protease YdiL (CAAX protease family)